MPACLCRGTFLSVCRALVRQLPHLPYLFPWPCLVLLISSGCHVYAIVVPCTRKNNKRNLFYFHECGEDLGLKLPKPLDGIVKIGIHWSCHDPVLCIEATKPCDHDPEQFLIYSLPYTVITLAMFMITACGWLEAGRRHCSLRATCLPWKLFLF